MEVDKEKYKQLVKNMLDNYRMLESELLAYRFMIHLVKEMEAVLQLHIPWDESLAAARQNPAVQQVMSTKYDPLVAQLLGAIDRAASDQELAELLKKWKPTGPTN